jgi:hypothetical protein
MKDELIYKLDLQLRMEQDQEGRPRFMAHEIERLRDWLAFEASPALLETIKQIDPRER